MSGFNSLALFETYAIKTFGENSLPHKYVEGQIKLYGSEHLVEDDIIMIMLLNEVSEREKLNNQLENV